MSSYSGLIFGVFLMVLGVFGIVITLVDTQRKPKVVASTSNIAVEKKKTIYDLNLGESLKIDNRFDVTCIRVPGGWAVMVVFGHGTGLTFVPYNEEFKANR